MNQEQYLRERVQDQIDWYSKKAGNNKRAYRTLRVVGVVIALSIPIMSVDLDEYNLRHLKLAIALAGAVVALVEAMLTLYKFRDNWTNYRNASEALLQHKYLFSTQSAPYNTTGSFRLFVQNAESIMSGERVMWLKQNTAPEGQLIPDKKDEEQVPPLPKQEAGTSQEEPAGSEDTDASTGAGDSESASIETKTETSSENTVPEGDGDKPL